MLVTQSIAREGRARLESGVYYRGCSGRAIQLGIGGAGIAVTSAHEGLRLVAGRERAAFSVDADRFDVELYASVERVTVPRGARLVFDSGAAWKLYRLADQHLFVFWSAALGTCPYKLVRLSAGYSRGRLLFNSRYFGTDGPLVALEYPLDELLVTHYLASRGTGVEVHACGAVDRRGDGYLFVGASGAGKSTTAGWWQRQVGPRILSDDRVIVRTRADGFRIYGTPWHGELPYSDTGAARLRGIYFLQKGARSELVRLRAAEAAARLLACSFFPLYDRRAIENCVCFAEQLCRSVPGYLMTVDLDGGADGLIWRISS